MNIPALRKIPSKNDNDIVTSSKPLNNLRPIPKDTNIYKNLSTSAVAGTNSYAASKLTSGVAHSYGSLASDEKQIGSKGRIDPYKSASTSRVAPSGVLTQRNDINGASSSSRKEKL